MATRRKTRIHMRPVFNSLGEPSWLLPAPFDSPASDAVRTLPEHARHWIESLQCWEIDHDYECDALDAVETALHSDECWCVPCPDGDPCPFWLRKRRGEICVELEYTDREPEQTEWPGDRDDPSKSTGSLPFFTEAEQAAMRESTRNFFRNMAGSYFGKFGEDLFDAVTGSAGHGGAGHPGFPRPTEMTREEAAAILGISWPCTPADVTTAFRRAAFRTHPDKGGSDAEMRKILRARETIQRSFRQN